MSSLCTEETAAASQATERRWCKRPSGPASDDDDDDDDVGKSASIGKKQRRVPLASMRSQQSQPSQRTQPLIHGERRVSSIPTPRRLDYQNGASRPFPPSSQPTIACHIDSPSVAHCTTGIVRSIRLENFKNHANFQLTFGPHANFIKGANGSGKSSILSAIIVALGGNPNKHSATAGGAKATANLIKEGTSYSSIELTLANGAEDPHQLDNGEVPESLVIRWRATLGAGGKATQEFRLNGVAVPQKRIRELADHFNLQVENPCVILTQAVSTNFLREAKDAGKRYEVRCSAMAHWEQGDRRLGDDRQLWFGMGRSDLGSAGNGEEHRSFWDSGGLGVGWGLTCEVERCVRWRSA